MADRGTDPKAPSLQAETVVGAGRGALIIAMFGAGLLGWGLGVAEAFNAMVGAAFGFTALLLWCWSIYTMLRGRRLRKQLPPIPASAGRTIGWPFLLVACIEVIALALAFIYSNQIHRPDLGADWAMMVVGLHYLPLAKIFRAPILGVLGTMITLWCLLSWALFRSDSLVISVAIGTGILLWLASAAALLRARAIAQRICRQQNRLAPFEAMDEIG